MEDKQELRGLDRFCMFLSRNRVSVLIVILVITGIFLYGAFRIRGEVLIYEMFPYDHPYLKLHARFSQVFGSGASGVVITLKAKNGDIFHPPILTKIQKMTNEIELWDEVYRVLTVSIASRTTKVVKAQAKGQIKIDPLMWPEVPKNDQEMALLKKDIFSDPAYNGILVSRDGTAALLLTEFKENISYERTFDLLQKLRKDYTDQRDLCSHRWIPHADGVDLQFEGTDLHCFYDQYHRHDRRSHPHILRQCLGNDCRHGQCVDPHPLGAWDSSASRGSTSTRCSMSLPFLWAPEWWATPIRSPTATLRSSIPAAGTGSVPVMRRCGPCSSPTLRRWPQTQPAFLVLIIAKIVLMQHLAIIMTFWMMSIILTGFMVPAICNLIPLKVASEKWAKDSCQVDWLARVMMRITRFAIGPRWQVCGGGLDHCVNHLLHLADEHSKNWRPHARLAHSLAKPSL